MDKPGSLSPTFPGRSLTNRNDILSNALSKLKHLDKSGLIVYDSADMHAHGGYCDVFVGRIKKAHLDPAHSCIITRDQSDSEPEVKIAIKRLRVHILNDKDFMKPFVKELRLWSKLQHGNILSLLGYSIEGVYPSILSEWMPNGTARRYVENNKLSAHQLLDMITGIASGVNYLHEKNIVHSDLKGDNILIGPSAEPLICDFGISRMINSSVTFGGTTVGGGTLRGTIRWMAPELLTCGNLHTKASDVWAFGMTVYEIVTKRHPFSHLRIDAQVITYVLNRGIPEFSHFSQFPDRSVSVAAPYSSSLSFSSSVDLKPMPVVVSASQASERSKDVGDRRDPQETPRGVLSEIWRVCLKSWEFSPDFRAEIRELLQYLSSLEVADTSTNSASDGGGVEALDTVEVAINKGRIKARKYSRPPQSTTNVNQMNPSPPSPSPSEFELESEVHTTDAELQPLHQDYQVKRKVHFQKKLDIIRTEPLSDTDTDNNGVFGGIKRADSDDDLGLFYPSDEDSTSRSSDGPGCLFGPSQGKPSIRHSIANPSANSTDQEVQTSLKSESGDRDNEDSIEEEEGSQLSTSSPSYQFNSDSYERIRKAKKNLLKAEEEVEAARKELATKCMTKGLIYTEISKAAQRLEEVETNLEKTKKELRELVSIVSAKRLAEGKSPMKGHENSPMDRWRNVQVD